MGKTAIDRDAHPAVTQEADQGSPRDALRAVTQDALRAALHPFLFSIFPVFSLACSNLAVLDPSSIWRPLAISLGIGCLFYLVWLLILRNPLKAGPAATLWILLALTYGNAYISLMNVEVNGVAVGRADVLAAR